MGLRFNATETVASGLWQRVAAAVATSALLCAGA